MFEEIPPTDRSGSPERGPVQDPGILSVDELFLTFSPQEANRALLHRILARSGVSVVNGQMQEPGYDVQPLRRRRTP